MVCNIYKKISLLTVLIACVPATAFATQVKIEFIINTVSEYNPINNQTSPTISVNRQGSMTFDIDNIVRVTDYGATTITDYGINDAKWTSPLTHLIPKDPYSGTYGSFQSSAAFSDVSDSHSSFLEEAAAQANSYGVLNNVTSFYHIELRATTWSSPRNGDGTSDYAFKRQELLDFYRAFVASGSPVRFSESYAKYSIVDNFPLYSEGMLWQSYDTKITSVTELTSPVPEPATPAMLVIGLLTLGIFRKLRKK